MCPVQIYRSIKLLEKDSLQHGAIKKIRRCQNANQRSKGYMFIVQIKIHRQRHDETFANVPPQKHDESTETEKFQATAFFSYFS